MFISSIFPFYCFFFLIYILKIFWSKLSFYVVFKKKNLLILPKKEKKRNYSRDSWLIPWTSSKPHPPNNPHYNNFAYFFHIFKIILQTNDKSPKKKKKSKEKKICQETHLAGGLAGSLPQGRRLLLFSFCRLFTLLSSTPASFPDRLSFKSTVSENPLFLTTSLPSLPPGSPSRSSVASKFRSGFSRSSPCMVAIFRATSMDITSLSTDILELCIKNSSQKLNWKES